MPACDHIVFNYNLGGASCADEPTENYDLNQQQKQQHSLSAATLLQKQAKSSNKPQHTPTV